MTASSSKPEQPPPQAGEGEHELRRLGYARGQVAVHGDAETGWLARIELPEDDLARALEPEMREKITAAFKALGFRFVSIDLQPR